MLDQFNSFLAGAEDVTRIRWITSRRRISHIHSERFLVHVGRISAIPQCPCPEKNQAITFLSLRRQRKAWISQLDVIEQLARDLLV